MSAIPKTIMSGSLDSFNLVTNQEESDTILTKIGELTDQYMAGMEKDLLPLIEKCSSIVKAYAFPSVRYNITSLLPHSKVNMTLFISDLLTDEPDKMYPICTQRPDLMNGIIEVLKNKGFIISAPIEKTSAFPIERVRA